MAWLNTKHLERFANGFAERILELFAKKTDIPEALPASGGNADTVNGHTVNEDVPQGAKFTDTKAVQMQAATAAAAGTSGLVPVPGKGKQNSFLRGDATWVEMTEATDTEIDAIIAGTFK